MADNVIFTTGKITSGTCTQSVFVDGCKVTLHYNKNSNSAVLREIKSILSSALLTHNNGENLQK